MSLSCSCGGQFCPDWRCGTCGQECDPDKARGFVKMRPWTRGDTIVLDFSLRDPNPPGAVPNLSDSGSKVWFTVKEFLSTQDQDAMFQGTIGSGVELLGGGRVRVTVPANTTAFVPDGTAKLYYDIQVLWGGRVWTQEKGVFLVDPDVTKATS